MYVYDLQTKLTTAATDLEDLHNGLYSTVKSDQARLLGDTNTLEQNTAKIPVSNHHIIIVTKIF